MHHLHLLRNSFQLSRSRVWPLISNIEQVRTFFYWAEWVEILHAWKKYENFHANPSEISYEQKIVPLILNPPFFGTPCILM